jgi:hypothetical protein
LGRAGIFNSGPFAASWATARSPQLTPVKTSPSLCPLLVAVSHPDTVAGNPRVPRAVIFKKSPRVAHSQSSGLQAVCRNTRLPASEG